MTPIAPATVSSGSKRAKSSKGGGRTRTLGGNGRNRYGFTLDELIERRNAFLAPLGIMLCVVFICVLLNLTVMKATPYYLAPGGLVFLGVFIMAIIRYAKMTRAIWGGGGAMLATLNFLIPFPIALILLPGAFIMACLGKVPFTQFLIFAAILIWPIGLVLWSIIRAGCVPKAYKMSKMEQRFGISPAFLWGIGGFFTFLIGIVVLIGVMATLDSRSESSDTAQDGLTLLKEPIFGYRSMNAKDAEKFGKKFTQNLGEGKGWEAFETIADDLNAVYAADSYNRDHHPREGEIPQELYAIAKKYVKEQGEEVIKRRETTERIEFLGTRPIGQTNAILLAFIPKDWPDSEAKGYLFFFVKKRGNEPRLGAIGYPDYDPDLDKLQREGVKRQFEEKERQFRAQFENGGAAGNNFASPTLVVRDMPQTNAAPPVTNEPFDDGTEDLEQNLPDALKFHFFDVRDAKTEDGERVEIAKLNEKLSPGLQAEVTQADDDGDGFLDRNEIARVAKPMVEPTTESQMTRQGGILTAKIDIPIGIRGSVNVNNAVTPDGMGVDLSKLTWGADPDIKLAKSFDADGNGILDEEELKAFDEKWMEKFHGPSPAPSPLPNGGKKPVLNDPSLRGLSISFVNGKGTVTCKKVEGEMTASFDERGIELAQLRDKGFPDAVIEKLSLKDANQDGFVTSEENLQK